MKADLDRLMVDRGLDAFVVLGGAEGNHVLKYMTNGASVTHTKVLKQRGENPVLICEPMEREEAAKSGLPTLTTTEFDYPALIRAAGSDFEAELRLLAAIFERYSVRGTVCFYGMEDPGKAFMLLSRLGEAIPDIRVTGETETTIFDEAYATKSEQEMAFIKDVAERTNRAFSDVIEFIKQHRVLDGRLVQDEGAPLTVGRVKSFLRGRLMEFGLVDDGETIFAVGRDAGVPHSRGEDDDVLEIGKSIIFDLFPRSLKHGYYHDMTRTFCLGYAPPEVQRAYDQTLQAFNAVMDALQVGERASLYQDIVCDVYEEHGHTTPRSHPGTVEGYVHSVGHGLGLQIHSRPRFRTNSDDLIAAGQVFTVEPGLYYPSRGYGIRVEDTIYVDAEGQIHSLTTFPKDLVLPIG